MTDFNRHTIPPSGWVFRQPQTGWSAPSPVAFTFDQQVLNIVKHRLANKAICQKYNLATNPEAVAQELENYTRARLGLSGAAPAPFPVSRSRSPASSVVAAAVTSLNGLRTSITDNIKRAAEGTAVVMDWLTSGGKPVENELAYRRASICSTCSKNVPGSWYTEAPAEIIRETLELRKDVKLETPSDGQLKSCNVCRCLNRLKVWCPMDHIVRSTKAYILSEFPSNCWITRRDK